MSFDFNNISEKLIQGSAAQVEQLTKEALESGIDPKEVLAKGFIPGMEVIGLRFKLNEIYIPEVLIAARAMHAGMAVLKPLLKESDTQENGKVIIGTVKGDLHDIGKNLVAMMLEGAGFTVIDLGIDVPREKFIATVKESNASVVALSALLTTTMPEIISIIENFKEEGLRDKVKIIVGGAPITKDWAEEVGADGYGDNASEAVDLAKHLVN
jgi:5-methyltetrahydrofolate--homocysteine methyltransferase